MSQSQASAVHVANGVEGAPAASLRNGLRPTLDTTQERSVSAHR